MKFKAYTGITWSNLELTGLLDEDADSQVCYEKVKKHFGLHPFHLTNLQAALNEILSSNLNSYDPELKGFLLAYKNPKVLTSLGEIFYDTCFIHIDVEADFYIFRPKVGCFLKGIVNKKGWSHIGILVHKAFNISVPKPDGEDTWVGSNLNMAQEVRVKVTHLDFSSRLPFIRATLEEETYLLGCRLPEALNTGENQRNAIKQSSEIAEKMQCEIGSTKQRASRLFFTSDSDDNSCNEFTAPAHSVNVHKPKQLLEKQKKDNEILEKSYKKGNHDQIKTVIENDNNVHQKQNKFKVEHEMQEEIENSKLKNISGDSNTSQPHKMRILKHGLKKSRCQNSSFNAVQSVGDEDVTTEEKVNDSVVVTDIIKEDTYVAKIKTETGLKRQKHSSVLQRDLNSSYSDTDGEYFNRKPIKKHKFSKSDVTEDVIAKQENDTSISKHNICRKRNTDKRKCNLVADCEIGKSDGGVITENVDIPTAVHSLETIVTKIKTERGTSRQTREKSLNKLSEAEVYAVTVKAEMERELRKGTTNLSVNDGLQMIKREVSFDDVVRQSSTTNIGSNSITSKIGKKRARRDLECSDAPGAVQENLRAGCGNKSCLVELNTCDTATYPVKRKVKKHKSKAEEQTYDVEATVQVPMILKSKSTVYDSDFKTPSVNVKHEKIQNGDETLADSKERNLLPALTTNLSIGSDRTYVVGEGDRKRKIKRKHERVSSNVIKVEPEPEIIVKQEQYDGSKKIKQEPETHVKMERVSSCDSLNHESKRSSNIHQSRKSPNKHLNKLNDQQSSFDGGNIKIKIEKES